MKKNEKHTRKNLFWKYPFVDDTSADKVLYPGGKKRDSDNRPKSNKTKLVEFLQKKKQNQEKKRIKELRQDIHELKESKEKEKRLEFLRNCKFDGDYEKGRMTRDLKNSLKEKEVNAERKAKKVMEVEEYLLGRHENNLMGLVDILLEDPLIKAFLPKEANCNNLNEGSWEIIDKVLEETGNDFTWKELFNS